MRVENHPHPWNCCQRCGQTLEVGKPAAGTYVPPDVIAKDINGKNMVYVYEHVGRCPKEK